MTDLDLVAKKLALIETCVRELRSLARPEQIRHDVREERFVEHTLLGPGKARVRYLSRDEP
jgi:hypothetical protein